MLNLSQLLKEKEVLLMHLFYNAFNRKSIPIDQQINDAIKATKNKVSDCQKRLDSEYGINEMLRRDLEQADDQHKVDYFQKQIVGVYRSIKVRKRRIQKYQDEIKELEEALNQINQKG